MPLSWYNRELKEKCLHQQIPPMLISLFDSIYPSASPFFFGRSLFSFLSSLFLHTFFVCQFSVHSQERDFSTVIPRIIFIVIFLFDWTWIEFQWGTLSWSAKNTHPNTQRDISTHISDLQIILFVFVFSFANSSNIWIKTSSRIWGIWNVYTWIKINCLLLSMTCLIDRRVSSISVRL